MPFFTQRYVPYYLANYFVTTMYVSNESMMKFRRNVLNAEEVSEEEIRLWKHKLKQMYIILQGVLTPYLWKLWIWMRQYDLRKLFLVMHVEHKRQTQHAVKKLHKRTFYNFI